MLNKEKIILNGIEFNKIKADYRTIFNKYICNDYFPLIHQSFAYNYALDGSRSNILLKSVYGCLCIFKMYKNRISLSGVPLGVDKDNCNSVINFCSEVIEKVNGRKTRFLGDNLSWENNCVKSLQYEYVLKPSILGKEYFYDCQEVYNMCGNKFDVFRRNVKRFIQLYNTTTYIGKVESKAILYELYNTWANEWLSRKSSLSLIFDYDYYKKSIDESNIIGQEFITVFEKDRLIGMAGIIPVNDKTFMCLNRKTLIEYSGLSEYLIYKSCQYAASKGCRYMDDSWDANHTGLRQFKNKCNPVNTVQLYQLIKN